MEPFKEMQRAIWESGDYSALAPIIAHVGEGVVAAAGIEPGMRVLDVACGTGNAAVPAARAGADVTGLDLAPKLLAAGRAQAAEQGLDITFVEGDAEELPFEAGSFDRVFSTFGHMFAPRHERTAAEMRRVARPDAAIAMATWRPDGTVGKLFAISARFAPPPPDFASPPLHWGTEDYVRERFPGAHDYEFEDRSATIEWESVDGFADLFLEHFPPMATARQMLGERFADLRAETVALWRELNQAQGGGFRLPQEYLQSVVRL